MVCRLVLNTAGSHSFMFGAADIRMSEKSSRITVFGHVSRKSSFRIQNGRGSRMVLNFCGKQCPIAMLGVWTGGSSYWHAAQPDCRRWVHFQDWRRMWKCGL